MSGQAHPPTETHTGSFTVLDWLGAVWGVYMPIFDLAGAISAE